jgi:hypothetical protein
MSDYAWEFGKTRTVHRTDDGDFVIAQNNQWLDGVFATEAEAWDAFDDERAALRVRVAELTDTVNAQDADIEVAEERLRVLTDAASAVFDAVTDEYDPLRMSNHVWISLDVLRAVLGSAAPPTPDEKVWTVGDVEVSDYHGPEEFRTIASTGETTP